LENILSNKFGENKMDQFTFGLDPEFMLCKDGKLVSAISCLPSKEKKKPYYYDNVLAEIIVEPASSKLDAVKNTRKSLRDLTKVLPKNIKFTIKSSTDYPSSELNCSESKIVSCNPEFNVYTLQKVFPPDEDVEFKDGYYQFKYPLRTAGGHIHVGSEFLQGSLDALNIIRIMDLFVGIPSLYLDTDTTSKRRKKLYGHAGSHRIQDHGVEYRTLGNFWISSPELFELIYDLTDFSYNFIHQGLHEKFWTINEDALDSDDPSMAFTCTGYDVDYLQKAINNCDKKMADKFLLFIQNYLPKNLIEKIESLSNKPLPDPYESWEI
jgi:hypothetical protein